jgi:hypothetical protein
MTDTEVSKDEMDKLIRGLHEKMNKEEEEEARLVHAKKARQTSWVPARLRSRKPVGQDDIQPQIDEVRLNLQAISIVLGSMPSDDQQIDQGSLSNVLDEQGQEKKGLSLASGAAASSSIEVVLNDDERVFQITVNDVPLVNDDGTIHGSRLQSVCLSIPYDSKGSSSTQPATVSPGSSVHTQGPG